MRSTTNRTFIPLAFLFLSMLVTLVALASQDNPGRDHALLPESVARKSAVNVVMPIYPEEAARLGVSAVVRIKLEISAEGEVLRIKVRPRTDPRLKQAVADAVKQWKFKPWPGADGAGRAVISRLAFRFIISEGEPYVRMYEPPGASQTECLGCYNSMLELRQWREWEDVPLHKPSEKP